MSFKKKDLEIVYNLRWKNGLKGENKKDMSIVAVYDIPSTTLNFEVFKSYLLKNSGTPEDDVNVTYIMDNGKKYPIQSQTDFQVALYAFRRKARAGEFINLLLERISDKPTHKNLRHSNDVETQSDNAGDHHSIVSTCTAIDTPPEWFIAGLAQLKKELKEELAVDVANIVGNALADLKPPVLSVPVPQVCPHRLRGKLEKRPRRITPYLNEGASDPKDFMKALKVESKLDKAERKASKYRERRLVLLHGQKSSDNGPKSSDSEAGPSCRRSRSRDKDENKVEEQQQVKKLEDEQKITIDEPKMDAKPLNVQSMVPHMLGGEIYLHQWEVQNTGQIQWTFMTQLEYTWGSKKLMPIEKSIAVPFLKPGEKGTISVRLRIPTQSGRYECYWQFTHNGRKFGHWLGVQVEVDAFDLKGHSSVLETTESQQEIDDYEKAIRRSLIPEHVFYRQQQDDGAPSTATATSNSGLQELMKEVSNDIQEMRIGPVNAEFYQKLDRIAQEDEVESDCSWSSDQDSVDRKSEFVVVPVPDCFVLDSPTSGTPNFPKNNEENQPTTSSKKEQNFDDNNNNSGASSSGSIKLRDEELDNIVVITVPKDDQVKEGYIYVHVDGQKVLIPKNILKSEVVSAAQELERSPSASNSVGVIIDSEPVSSKSPTPSVASTIPPRRTAMENALDSVPPKTLEEPIVPQQATVLQREAVDLSTASRENLECGLEDGPERSNYFEANNYMSHCSAAGSCFSEINSQAEIQNRLFVFPQDVPGYEVVYPVLDVNDPNHPNLTSETFATAPPANSSVHYNIPPQPLAANPFMEAVPNYQQTPEDLRAAPIDPGTEPSLYGAHYQEAPQNYQQGAEPQNQRPKETTRTQPTEGGASGPTQVHILPETLVSGAVNVASSAINTARSMINMIKPQAPGRWVNGHWVSANPETPREANLHALAEMGFWNRDLNATLLARFNDDLNRVVAELVQ